MPRSLGDLSRSRRIELGHGVAQGGADRQRRRRCAPARCKITLDRGTIDLGPGPAVVFGQTILAAADKETFEWLNPAGYDAVRGSFVTSSDIGTYALDASASGNDTFFTDVSVPQPGTGFWYLVRPGGCTLSSWQTILNGEPGRDVALP